MQCQTEKTALHRGRTDRMTMTLTCDLDLQSPESCGHYLHAKVQGQQSVGFRR